MRFRTRCALNQRCICIHSKVMPVYSQPTCVARELNRYANHLLVGFMASSKAEQPRKIFTKTWSSFQRHRNKRTHQRSILNFDMSTRRKRSIFSLDHIYHAGRGIQLNVPCYCGDQEEGMLVLSVIRACLGGVLVVDLDLNTHGKSVKVTVKHLLYPDVA